MLISSFSLAKWLERGPYPRLLRNICLLHQENLKKKLRKHVSTEQAEINFVTRDSEGTSSTLMQGIDKDKKEKETLKLLIINRIEVKLREDLANLLAMVQETKKTQ